MPLNQGGCFYHISYRGGGEWVGRFFESVCIERGRNFFISIMLSELFKVYKRTVVKIKYCEP